MNDTCIKIGRVDSLHMNSLSNDSKHVENLTELFGDFLSRCTRAQPHHEPLRQVWSTDVWNCKRERESQEKVRKRADVTERANRVTSREKEKECRPSISHCSSSENRQKLRAHEEEKPDPHRLAQKQEQSEYREKARLKAQGIRKHTNSPVSLHSMRTGSVQCNPTDAGGCLPSCMQTQPPPEVGEDPHPMQ